MTENPDSPPSGDVVSLRLEGEFADEVDRIARQDGCSRSEVLRRLLVANLERQGLVTTVRWIRTLRVIKGQLLALRENFEEAEADDAAQAIEDAVDAIVAAIDELEDFEPEDD